MTEEKRRVPGPLHRQVRGLIERLGMSYVTSLIVAQIPKA